MWILGLKGSMLVLSKASMMIFFRVVQVMENLESHGI